jgi:putative membrane protein
MAMIDFLTPSRQSSKGVLIIFAFKTFQFFRKFFVLFIAFGISIAKKKTFSFLTPNILTLLVISVLVVILILAILKYLNFKFYVDTDDFHLTTGILNKDHTVIPKSKIQNVYIKQNWLQQLINVVSVNIETAGDEKSEIEINALDRSIALKLKSELYSSISSETQEDKVRNPNNIFFKASVYRLLLEGVSQNHLKSFAVIASFAFGVFYEFKSYITNLSVYDQIEKSIEIKESSLFNILLANVIVVVVVIVVSMLFSVVKTFISNFNLEVVAHEHTIEINKGLFNKVSLTLTPSRIQNIVIKTNRLKHYLGLNTMSVKQAMVNKKQRKSFNIVALEQAQVIRLIDKLYRGYEQHAEWSNPELYYKRILWMHAFLVSVLVNVIAYGILDMYFWLVNIVVVGVSFCYVHFKYKKAKFQITENFVTVTHGFIDSTTTILEIHKIQSLQLKQNIFQKRKQIVSLIIATASSSTVLPYVNEKEANRIYNYLLFKVESQDKDWM